MSDWQVGDLAVCVDLRRLCPKDKMSPDLQEGGVYTVTAVVEGWGHLGIREQGLCLKDVVPADPKCIGFAAARFRKIRPDEHEACEAEFVTLLKRSKRKVAA